MNFIYGNVARILLRYRRFLAAGILFLLGGVVVLSIATRRPCLQVHSGPWHTFKAGHMITPEGHEAHKAPLALVDRAPQVISRESLLVFSSHVLREEVSFPGLTIIVQIRNFRSPPHLS